MKKFILINGSPRVGANSDGITELAAKMLQDAGAEVETFNIRDRKINSCVACNTCKTNGCVCVHKDDMAELLEKIKSCDGILLTSPIYFAGLPGTVKVLIDRLYAIFDPTKDPGANGGTEKKLGIALTFGAGSPEDYAAVAKQTFYSFAVAGAKKHKTALFSGENSPKAFGKNEQYQNELKELMGWMYE